VNKAELIEALAQHYDGSKAEATKALNAVVQTITYSAAAGEKVAITGFGVFEKIDRPARMVRNPRTGERKEAAATSVPRFRAGTDLKAYVSGERALPAAAAPVATAAPVRRPSSRTRTAGTAAPAPVAVEPVATPAPTGSGKKKDGPKDTKKAASAKVESAKKAGSAKKVESAKKSKPAKKKDGKKAKSGK
jgi:DNA-binding protein HU-beta